MRADCSVKGLRISSRGFCFALVPVAAALLAVLLLSCPLQASELVVSSTGLRFEIHSAAEISSSFLYRVDGRVSLRHPSCGEIELLDGPDDPRQERPGVTEFFPFELEDVRLSAGRVSGFSTSLDVHVFILPAPPVLTQSSYADKNVIFLAPGYAQVPTATIAYILAHELGHVLTWAFLDPSPARWSEYCRIRGLDPMSDGPAVPHAERNREIFAEDFRYLFGGPLAACDGGIENSHLVLPDMVFGLREKFVSWFAFAPVVGPTVVPSTVFPNPCNPTTRIEMVLPAGEGGGAAATLVIYDISGRLIRTLRTTAGDDRVSFQWRGCDNGRRMVASGSYPYVISCGQVRGQGSIILVR